MTRCGVGQHVGGRQEDRQADLKRLGGFYGLDGQGTGEVSGTPA